MEKDESYFERHRKSHRFQVVRICGILNVDETKIQKYRALFKIPVLEPFICARESIYKKHNGQLLIWEHFFCFLSEDWEQIDKPPKYKIILPFKGILLFKKK
jgi:hypothetical protein